MIKPFGVAILKVNGHFIFSLKISTMLMKKEQVIFIPFYWVLMLYEISTAREIQNVTYLS
jgi:hypothetical protein